MVNVISSELEKVLVEQYQCHGFANDTISWEDVSCEPYGLRSRIGSNTLSGQRRAYRGGRNRPAISIESPG